jgi:hypothetical protein
MADGVAKVLKIAAVIGPQERCGIVVAAQPENESSVTFEENWT